MGVIQKQYLGHGDLQQVAGAAHGVGVGCAPSLAMPTAPPSSEVSASIGKTPFGSIAAEIGNHDG